MPLGHEQGEIMAQDVRENSEYARALLAEALTVLLDGETGTAKVMLRALVNGTSGFKAIAQQAGLSERSIRRMLSPAGTPRMENLVAISKALGETLGVWTRESQEKIAQRLRVGPEQNVYEELQVSDPQEMLLKANIVTSILQHMRERGLTQTAAGKIIGVKQPTLSKILRGHFHDVSIETLTAYLKALTGETGKYQSEPMEALHTMVEDLHEIGLVDQKTMREFDEACLTRDFKDTVVKRADRDPEFTRALCAEAAELVENGEPEAACGMLRMLTNAPRAYKSDLSASIHEVAEALYSVGAIDKKTMRRFDRDCLVPIEALEPTKKVQKRTPPKG